MAALPILWWLVARRPAIVRLQWTAFTLVTAYEDTLGDEVLGSLGAIVAALIVTRSVSSDSGTSP